MKIAETQCSVESGSTTELQIDINHVSDSYRNQSHNLTKYERLLGEALSGDPAASLIRTPDHKHSRENQFSSLLILKFLQFPQFDPATWLFNKWISGSFFQLMSAVNKTVNHDQGLCLGEEKNEARLSQHLYVQLEDDSFHQREIDIPLRCIEKAVGQSPEGDQRLQPEAFCCKMIFPFCKLIQLLDSYQD